MSVNINGSTIVAGVAGSPVRHSLSPLLHNAWIADAGLDAVYVPFTPPVAEFRCFLEGLRGGAIRGLNVTLPFKEDALNGADRPTERASRAQAANLLIFDPDGTIIADNTDGMGLLAAFAEQAPGFDPKAGPVAILGAGGAARGAAAAFVDAGASDVRVINRTLAKAEFIKGALDGPVSAWRLDKAAEAFQGVKAVINATSVGLTADDDQPVFPLEATPEDAVAMDMVYKPLRTPFLQQAEKLGRRTVDGLAMLIGQAVPSFEAFFGRPPPKETDVRKLALEVLETRG